MADRVPQSLVDAARFERDRRAESYPPLVAAGKLGAEQGTADYQAWCAILQWLETGRFVSFEGGTDGATMIDWAFVEAAAAKALAKLDAKAERDGEAKVRRDRVFCIHRMVARERRLIDAINAELRKRLGREPVAA